MNTTAKRNSVVQMTATTLSFVLCAVCAVTRPASAQEARTITWETKGMHVGKRAAGILLACPPRGVVYATWGTGSYTDDSSICTAAAHQGYINLAEGGVFLLQSGPGEQQYTGSTRYGITTQSYGAWEGSFYLSAYEPPPPASEPAVSAAPASAAAPMPASIAWTTTAQGLGPNGARFTRRCPPAGKTAVVIGDGIYATNSSICSAAVHAGAITASQGGSVTFQMRVGLTRYGGALKNGVTSVAGEGTLLGFEIIRRGR